METVRNFIFLGSKIIADSDSIHKIKRCLEEIYDKLRQHIKKQRHYFAYKCPYSQSSDFSRSHVRCESWTIQKAEHQRIDAFNLWCWGRFLRVPWKERRSNQSILKEINLVYSLEGLMLKLKLQDFGHLMRRAN